jgi:hypothetical protein
MLEDQLLQPRRAKRDRFMSRKPWEVAIVEIEGMGLSQRLGNGRRRIVEVRCNSRIGRRQHVPGFNGDGATWWRLCLTGFLDRLASIKDFNPFLEIASGVHFSFLKPAVLHQCCQDESSKGP